jgi:hypothetical protein
VIIDSVSVSFRFTSECGAVRGKVDVSACDSVTSGPIITPSPLNPSAFLHTMSQPTKKVLVDEDFDDLDG